MKRLRIHLLGTFWVTINDKPVTEFEADTVRALLAYLAMNNTYPHRRERLFQLLWPDQPRENGQTNLQTALNCLRTALADTETDVPFILTGPQDILLNPKASVWVDMHEMERLLGEVKHHEHHHLQDCPWCLARLNRIAELYRGEFMSDLSIESLPFEEWQTTRREEAHRLTTQVMSTLAGHQGWSANTELESSWTLLNSVEQQILASLSAFQGGCTIDAAQTVTGASLETLTRLVDSSLLPYHTPSGRFIIPEALRQFAVEKLITLEGEAVPVDTLVQADIARRHSNYYLLLVSALEPTLYGRDPLAAASLLQADLGNVEQAWSWATERADVDLLTNCLPGIARFYDILGLRSNARLGLSQDTAALLAQPEPRTPHAQALLSSLLTEGVTTQLARGDLSEAKAQAVRAIAYARVYGDSQLWAQAALALGQVFQREGRIESALLYFELALSKAQHAQNLALEVESLSLLNFSLTRTLDYSHLALQKVQMLEDSWLSAQVLNRLGISAANQGQFLLAKECFDQVRTLPETYTHDSYDSSALEVPAGEIITVGSIDSTI